MPINTAVLVDILGWLGAAMLLVAYALVSARKVQGDSAPYQLLNAVGSIFLMLNTAYYGAYPSTFVNLVWLVIAAYTLKKVMSKVSARA